MTIIILLISISLTIAILFVGIFYWSIRTGQYSDTYTPSIRMLFDDQQQAKSKTKLNPHDHDQSQSAASKV